MSYYFILRLPHCSYDIISEETVKLLLSAGAYVNARLTLGQSALFAASEGGVASVCTLLLQHGAEINFKDIHGNTALSVAVEVRLALYLCIRSLFVISHFIPLRSSLSLLNLLQGSAA